MSKIILHALMINALLFGAQVYAQKISLCELIGQKVNVVVKQYGKPQHHDKSNPNMECLFYQSKTARMAFIADKQGVYQIQIDYYYNSKKEADTVMSRFLRECGSKSMVIDTVNAGDFRITTHGVKMNLALFENTFTKKYEIKFKADRSESK